MTLAAANAALWLLLLPLQARDLQELESAVTQSLRDIFQSASQQQSPAKYAAMLWLPSCGTGDHLSHCTPQPRRKHKHRRPDAIRTAERTKLFGERDRQTALAAADALASPTASIGVRRRRRRRCRGMRFDFDTCLTAYGPAM